MLNGAQLAWSTYVGNASDDLAFGIAVDSQNNVIVSVETIVNFNTLDSVALVQKISPDGKQLIWTKYLDSTDYPNRVAVDANDNIYVVGCSDNGNGFLIKLNSDGNVVWERYLGGEQYDEAWGVAIDKDGNVIVCGMTESAGWINKGYDTSYNGGNNEDTAGDAFLVKISPTGAFIWGTYIGGSDYDEAVAVAVDGQGNVFVVGTTYSSGWPKKGFDTSYNGGEGDGFLAKFDSDGNHMWSTYIGAGYPEGVCDVAVDLQGNPVIVGASGPMGWIKGGYDTTFAGGKTKMPDGFAGKIKSDGSGAIWGTYIGGSKFEWASSVAIDPNNGDIIVFGGTNSAGWVKDGFDTSHNGNFDTFVVRLTSTGGHIWSSYLGGTDNDYSHTVAIDHAGDILVAGQTASAGWVSGGYDTIYAGGTIGADTDEGEEGIDGDGFVAKIHQLPINHAPVLTKVGTLTGAQQDWPFEITYEKLLDASDLIDPDNDQVLFRLSSVANGTKSITTADGTKVTAGSTLGPGQKWIWYPASRKNGILNAFAVAGWDGKLASDTVQVKIDVSKIPDLQPTAVDSNVWQSAKPGTEVEWTTTIKNNGPANQQAAWKLQWYLSTDNKLGDTDIFIGSETYDDDIVSKGTVTKHYDAPVPGIANPGQYYVIAKVINTGPDSNSKNDTKASTDKDWFGAVTADGYTNDTRQTAYDLGSAKVTLNNLTLDRTDDEDWFKFTLQKAGTSKQKVQIDFTNIEGDLVIELYYGQDEQPLKRVDTTANSHQIGLNKLVAGTYYIRVLAHQQAGYLPDVCRKYKLTLVL